MFFILLGIALAVISFVVGVICNWSETLISTVGAGLIVIGITVGVFVPVSGYEEKVSVEEIELVNLSDRTVSTGGGVIYISVEANNSYSYYVEVESEFAEGDSKSYKNYVISGENVTIIEDDSYTTPKLVKYEGKAKRSFWTFAAFCKPDVEYVFYVPTGTVVRNISVG
ncbi:MAG: hypothetical protein E7314_04140 [Clostridiales bacterium]|nr:hypothetical protein [Clostridiales bacterium]